MQHSNFLLFIPANAPSLRAILSYYSSTVTVNPEGDVHVSDETVEGLGKDQFLKSLFGAVARVFIPPRSSTARLPNPDLTTQPRRPGQPSDDSKPTTFPWDPGDHAQEEHHDLAPTVIVSEDADHDELDEREPGLLTELLPHPGYFLAGGIAGVVSRTATAPLDRLKVYLIAQVDARQDTIHAARSGAPVKAAKTAARPLVEATRAIWRMGGMRSLFAGSYSDLCLFPARR